MPRARCAANPLRDAPAEVTGGYRESDAQYEALTARRPVAEAAIVSVVAENDHVDMRRGVAVAGLLTSEPHNGIPNVVGVRTEAGEDLHADVVIDCAGRRSTLPKWLTELGAPAPEEKLADCGFVYYGRHFKSADGSVPFAFGPLLMDYGTISTLTLPADNGTWGLGITASANDKPMRRLKDVDIWERVLQGFPLVAHWLEGEPLDSNVLVMAKIEDRHRSFVIDGQPLATGVLALADSWACTNPSLGRGISIGMIHAVALRDLLRDPPEDPVALARAWDAATTSTVEPYFNGTMHYDESRLAQVDAEINGVEFEPNEEYELTRALMTAGGKDPEMLRQFIDLAAVMAAPSEIFARPGLRERATELGGNWRDEPLPGLGREELLAIVG